MEPEVCLPHALGRVDPSLASGDITAKVFSNYSHLCCMFTLSAGGGITREACSGAVSMRVHQRPHLGVAETLGAVRRHLPSQEAGSPGRAHPQTGAGDSFESSRSAASPWTAETAQPRALGAGGQAEGQQSPAPLQASPSRAWAIAHPPHGRTAHACTVLGENSSFPRCPPKSRPQLMQPGQA